MTERTPVNLLKVAALASFASALTTAILIYGPNADAGAGLLEQARLHDNWQYLYKRWVLFFHPQFAFVASVGVAFALYARHPALVVIGLFYLLVWAVTEMTQQAYIIDALNAYWRPGLLGAESDAARARYETLITGFRAISDSQYFVLLFGFGVGTTLYGWAFLSAGRFGQAIGITLLFLGALTLVAFMGYYAGASAVTPITGWIYANLYGVLQTGVRIALGVWLWRRAQAVA